MHDPKREKRRPVARAKLAVLAGAMVSLAIGNPAWGAAGATELPIRGTGSGTSVTTYAATPGDPATFVTEDHAHLSHLGDSTVHVTGTSTLTATGVDLAGSVTIEAANDDELTLTFSGSGVMTDTGLEATSVGEITGGTGRFENASGTITHEAVLTIADLSPPTVTASVVSSFYGTISY
jgi:plastocyanin